MSTDYMSENLQHYGVLGMKWGIRRARRSLSRASTKEESRRAISKLETHRGKINKKINRYQSENVTLRKKSDKRANDSYTVPNSNTHNSIHDDYSVYSNTPSINVYGK